MRRILKRTLTPLLYLAAALFFLAEGLLWRMAAVYAWLGRQPVLRHLERAIAALPPYPALAVFALPAIALAPIKFLALYWIAGGHPSLGIGVIAAAKVAGTALVARLYQLTRPQLITLAWFARAESMVVAVRAAAFEWWRLSPAGRRCLALLQRFRRWRQEFRQRSRHWIAQRFQIIRRRIAGRGKIAPHTPPQPRN